jgi:predicted HTH domain antitoxin
MHNTITIEFPKMFEANEFEIKMLLASKLYELGKLSSGEAAEMVDVSKRAFLELLGKYDVSIFGYTAEELRDELKNL